MDQYFNANKTLWEEWTEIHKVSEFYDVKGFIKGRQTLDQIELDELGDVNGKTLLHLQCHFGLDTLSLARLGAKVTGVDFSEKSIELAIFLAKKIQIDAEFVCSNIYDLQEKIDKQFDIVFTSGGVLTWLPDLVKWAKIIASSLKEGGTFYIREFHPFSNTFDDEAQEVKIRYNYFQDKEPDTFFINESYADTDSKTSKELLSYEWNYSVSSIINSLIKAGLKINFFNEFPFTSYKSLPYLIKNEKGYWEMPKNETAAPLMFSLKATK
jgi:SAM-dependent methyltransferase